MDWLPHWIDVWQVCLYVMWYWIGYNNATKDANRE